MQNSMIKLFICSCFLICVVLVSTAQDNPIPKLKLQIKRHQNDTAGIELLRNLSLQIQSTHPDSALMFAQQGLDLAKKFSFKKGEADCMNRIGVLLWKNGKYDRALLFLLGSLKIREGIKDRLGILKSLSDIGIVYSDQKDNLKALSYHFKAKSVAEELNEKRRLGIILSNIGNCYIKLNKVDSALSYEMQAYAIQQSIKDFSTLPNTLSILGDINFKMGHNALALDYYRVSVNLATKNGDQSGLSDSYNGMAKLYKHLNLLDSCIFYAVKALNAADISMYPEGIYDASNLLTNIYKGSNEHLELMYLKKASAAKDTMFNSDKVKLVQKLSFDEAVRQEEIAAEKHLEEETRIINLQLIGIAIFIPFFFLSLLILNKSRTHRKVIEFMGVLSLLLVFEFIALFIHPLVMQISNHLPLLELGILVILASILVPLHHRMTIWMHEKLVHPSSPHQPKSKSTKQIKPWPT